MGNSKLKPCPFCGSNDVECFEISIEIAPGKYGVGCNHCGISVTRIKSREEAVERWNRRAWIPPDDYHDAKIGDIVEFSGVKLKVVEDRNKESANCERYCYFYNHCMCNIVCCADRADGIPVFFKKVDDK